MSKPVEVWASGSAYEPYVGRWSRPVAAEFVSWLPVPAQRAWLDVGCGTAAVTQAILRAAQPASVVGVDPSDGYVGYARRYVTDPRASFEPGDAMALPFAAPRFDAVVSGLVLNFVPDPAAAVREMARVTTPGGLVAGYVWDYAGEMQLMRHFWTAAAELDPGAAHLDEGTRFPICSPATLADLFVGAGLADVQTRAIDVPTTFRDFDDYWTPFLGGQGPAPGYAMSLTAGDRERLRERIRGRLPFAADGSIPLIARAWAVRGQTG
jgi:SAM-dependent methyltransferase